MIWIIGGTTEAGKFVKMLQGQVNYIVTVATEGGKEVLPEDAPVIVARLTPDQMRGFIRNHAIDTVVDLTHPYAIEVSHNARQVCQGCGVRYLRYLRETSPVEGALCVNSIGACQTLLQTLHGTIFFTTGSKNIGDFQAVRGHNRFVYRVLPTPASLELCRQHQVEMQDIVAILGPVSEALNIAMFREYQADYVVMKDSGTTGGTPAKLAACRALNIPPILITRPPDTGIPDLATLYEMLLTENKE